jgi:hypothetical protein
MAVLFLGRYSPAFIGLHFFGACSLQQVARRSTIVAASGKLKKATLYLSGIFSPQSSISWAVLLLTERGGSSTR